MTPCSPLYLFEQEPTLAFSAPFEWLVEEGIRVEDPVLYERAVDVARQLIAYETDRGDGYIPEVVEEDLLPFIEMHERTPAPAAT